MESAKINPSTTQWYVLYTSAQAEKQVNIRLCEKGIETWLPIHRSPRVWSDRVKIVDIPLFRSYIFVKCPLHVLYTLTMVYGVSRIVMYDGKPAILYQHDIDAIKEFLQLAEKKEIVIGDDVEVLSGPMKNVSGKVRKIGNKMIMLYIEQMGVVMHVPVSQVSHANRLR
ncbi:MAG: UpxY family transcription antiterminator [Tannerellaceae bacterium]|jgi:transcription antitermination factor NusG|nr:UpxY family transcription antiterminator [Tannerellaceae bacterium]